MTKLLTLSASVLASLSLAAAPASAQSDSDTTETDDSATMEMNDVEHVALETSLGTIVLALDAENTPISTENFLKYVQDDFYEGTIFHRVIANFMIQGGGFTQDMDRKPTREPIENEWEQGLDNTRGTIAMARTPDPNSATSQFFINVRDNNRLDQPISGGAGYAAFGTVVGGMDVVEAIENVKTKTVALGGGQMRDVPADTITIESTERLTQDEAESMLETLDEKNAQALQQWKDKATEREEARQKEWEERNKAQMDAGKAFIEGTGVDISDARTTESGLWLLDTQEGQGEEVSPGATVTVHYDLWLTDGTPVQSSRNKGRKATFPLSGVIDAWKEGIPGMKPGGIRWMIAPPYLAYGAAGRPGIPENSALVFKVEMFESD
jgi:cyclophilin family peptidyl-prolyl cis-trans isomerase